MRVYNFSAGPAAMPLEVLEEAAAEITDWQGSGMSVMEVSHRGKPFVAYAAETEAALRRVMGISDDYAVLIIQGGAMGQFAAIPMNLSAPGDVVDFVKVNVPEALRKRLDVTDFATPVLTVDTVQQGANSTRRTR